MPSEHGHRLYVKGRHLSYQRSKHQLNPNTSLIKLDGVDDTNAANFYLGKKVAFVYRAKREVRGSNIRVIWGKVTRAHGMFNDLRSVVIGQRQLRILGRTKCSEVKERPGKLTEDAIAGNSGVVRAQFRNNLPPKSFGASVRVMLYPSNI